jgi:two-component system, NtrC family, sensor kinase
MRTLSARILLGFVALTISFGVFVVTIVLNLREAEDEVARTVEGDVPLATTSTDLAQLQREIRSYLDDRILDDAGRPIEAMRKTIATLRNRRDRALTEISRLTDLLRSLDDPGALAHRGDGGEPRPDAEPTGEELRSKVSELDPLYARLLATSLPRIPGRTDPDFQASYDRLDPAQRAALDALHQLRDLEAAIGHRAEKLADVSKRRMNRAKDLLPGHERTILLRAVYLGIATVVLCFFITVWVAVTLRPLRRLREGARRIAAGDYGKRVSETGPTEIAELAREFNSMGRAVQEREEEKLRAARLAMIGRMAGQIAHEVRNPLSSIGLNTELLEDELHENATEARELCRAIHAEVNRLTEVTEIYLGLRGGKPKLARESLNTIIADLVGFVRNDLASRRVALRTELDPEDPTGYVDANQIRQCLINLVRNAADAVSVKGGGDVVLRTRTERSRVEIAVEDNGVGIASELIPRLFDPFYSTKEGGNGLGLALTQQIVRDHGGEIHVASRVGRGTTFTLSVPAG